MICAARCGPVHPASPLSVCQRCSVSQCARRCYAPHRCRGGTSPVLRRCWSVRCGADMASAPWRIVLDQPSPAARPGCRIRGTCGTCPLRPPASLLHNAALPSVPASRCAKAALRAGHRFAPFGLRQQALCKVAFAGVGRTAFGSSRSLARPTRRRLRALVVVVAPWHQSGAVRCVVGQWPAASNCVCAPAHPCASPLRGISPARWSARPPPVGADRRAHF